MRRLLLAAGVLGALVAAVPAAGFHFETRPAQWSLLKVSPSGRYLSIGAIGGGCSRQLEVTNVREDARSVTLTVVQPVVVPDAGRPEVCTAEARILRAGVHLSAPLGGRALVGQWRLGMWSARPAAPRMVGARAGDAMRALANQAIHTRLIGPVDGTVVRQRPAAGRAVGRTGITLVAR